MTKPCTYNTVVVGGPNLLAPLLPLSFSADPVVLTLSRLEAVVGALGRLGAPSMADLQLPRGLELIIGAVLGCALGC